MNQNTRVHIQMDAACSLKINLFQCYAGTTGHMAGNANGNCGLNGENCNWTGNRVASQERAKRAIEG